MTQYAKPRLVLGAAIALLVILHVGTTFCQAGTRPVLLTKNSWSAFEETVMGNSYK